MNRNHPIRGAVTSDEAFVRSRIRKAKSINGIPYTLDHRHFLGQEATFFVTLQTRPADIDAAVIKLKLKRNVTRSVVLLVPPTWLQSGTYPQEETAKKPAFDRRWSYRDQRKNHTTEEIE